MKLRFNSFDIVCGITELQSLVGLRVNQIYDIDNKTYLIRFQGGGEAKKMLLIESGIRFHTTHFDWPKNMAPSGFSMKLRKHLKNKRLEKLQQLGSDRIVDFQFGMGEAAYHIFVEFYDRGNIVLTDYNLTILCTLRPHTEGDDVRFAVREKYPIERAKKDLPLPCEPELIKIITEANTSGSLCRVITPFVSCGPTVVEHVLTKYNLNRCIITNNDGVENTDECSTKKGNGKTITKRLKSKRYRQQLNNSREFNIQNDMENLMFAIKDISQIMEEAKRIVSRGFIIQKKEDKPLTEGEKTIEHFYQNIEYHPYNFCQFEGQPIAEFESFMIAVDEFYSGLESQKIDIKTLQQEREALKKLSNVKKDHAKRIEDLNKMQEGDEKKAELITMNQSLVDNAILAIRSAIANQMSWPDIHELVKAAQMNSDPVAAAIKLLKLEVNHISLILTDPYDFTTEGNESETRRTSAMIVDVDLSLSAWANARNYYDQKRFSAQKEQKTINASKKALKSAERKTQQTLKDVRTIAVISKARKVYWFEKFYWFITSENYLVIGGRDAQQNELIVKRYMGPNDIYVHADIQGASSVVVRNPKAVDVPPKSLLEAGTMAISYSVAWDAKVVANAYWVRSDQVSKTAPTGEYLGTGSFMIRGKKNFLPSCHLVMGISLLFKLEDSYIENHRGERKVRSLEEYEPQSENKSTSSLEKENICDITEKKLELHEQSDGNKDKKREFETKNGILSEFPDTQVKVEHDAGGMSVKNKFSSTNVLNQFEQPKIDDYISTIEELTIITAAPSRNKQQQNSKKRREDKDKKSRKTHNQLLEKQQLMNDCEKINNSQAVKRGQKGKIKKIKAKYKDQDEEERKLRMQILKSAGKVDEVTADPEETLECLEFKTTNMIPCEKQIYREDLDVVDDVLTGGDVEIIDSLTGQPYDNDELLFVIPVVAPYQAIQNYKYKVKLTPGSGKRGRTAKTALNMFSMDKMCTPREKDLLKSVRDEALARNIPVKVKLSAPQLQKFKK